MTADAALVHGAARLLDARIGLKPDASFRPRLARALKDVADAKHMDRERLLAALASDSSLLESLIDRVTVQETAFFRHPEQFEAISQLLPTMDSPVRAWSAACANGQEAYSLAMLFSETTGSGSVLATDISHAALRRTSSGRYGEREMSGISADRRRQHFVSEGGKWQVQQSLRDMVQVQPHNLLDDVPGEVAACQLVMCRNVLIYFTQPHAGAFLARLADAMNPDGYLFVGGAETLWQLTERFEAVQLGACFAYRPRPVGWKRPAPITIAGERGRAHKSAAVHQPQVQSPTSPASAAVSPPVPRPTSRPAQRSTRHETTGADAADQQPGARLLAEGRTAEAIVALRQEAYLNPDDPTAHFHLGMALDEAGEHTAARRSYRVALSTLDRCGDEALSHVLRGFDRAELRRLLKERSVATKDRADAGYQDAPTTPTESS